DMLVVDAFDRFLNHMVAVLIVDQPEGGFSPGFGDQLSLLVGQNAFQSLAGGVGEQRRRLDRGMTAYLLYDAAAVHLKTQRNDAILHLIGQVLLLTLIAVFEEFLDHVVAEDILHQLHTVPLDLVEDAFLLLAVGGLQLLLNQSGAMLVSGELDNVSP